MPNDPELLSYAQNTSLVNSSRLALALSTSFSRRHEGLFIRLVWSSTRIFWVYVELDDDARSDTTHTSKRRPPEFLTSSTFEDQ